MTLEELEARLNPLLSTNAYYYKAFPDGHEYTMKNGEKYMTFHADIVAKWDRSDLVAFEEKIKKLEDAKVIIDALPPPL